MQSVDRAVSILQVIAARGSAGITGIAEDLGLHKSTVARLVSTLEARGLVGQESERGHYRIGPALRALAAAGPGPEGLSAAARTECAELAQFAGETVNISVTDGTDVVTTEQWLGPAAISSKDWVGKRTPLHATAAGKLLLAHLPSQRAEQILAGELPRFTPFTVTDPGALAAELTHIRQSGLAAVNEEHEAGLVAIACGIRSSTGEIVAALSVSGPNFRLVATVIDTLKEPLAETARRISWRNGWVKPG